MWLILQTVNKASSALHAGTSGLMRYISLSYLQSGSFSDWPISSRGQRIHFLYVPQPVCRGIVFTKTRKHSPLLCVSASPHKTECSLVCSDAQMLLPVCSHVGCSVTPVVGNTSAAGHRLWPANSRKRRAGRTQGFILRGSFPDKEWRVLKEHVCFDIPYVA